MALLEADPVNRHCLLRLADGVRSRRMGEEVHLRGVIEFSNYFSSRCLYCGLRSGNRRLIRYRMEPGEILAAARAAARLGLKTIVLQSGEDHYYTVDTLTRIISKIKDSLDVAVTLSVGLRPYGDLLAFRNAGADRYLLKFETADPLLFTRLRPGTTLSDRIKSIRQLKHIGYQVGAGSIVGLPGQTSRTIARDILLLRKLDVEMAGIGPFIPHPGTPLGGNPPGSLETTLTVLAIVRLLMPQLHLPATTALDAISKEGRRLALQYGSNVIMPNVTPARYRPFYSIYPGKAGGNLDPATAVEEVRSWIESLGRTAGSGYGHSSGHKSFPSPIR